MVVAYLCYCNFAYATSSCKVFGYTILNVALVTYSGIGENVCKMCRIHCTFVIVAYIGKYIKAN